MKAGPLWRGFSIALRERLTCMAVPSWNWPTAKFLSEGLRPRGPDYDNLVFTRAYLLREQLHHRSISIIKQNGKTRKEDR